MPRQPLLRLAVAIAIATLGHACTTDEDCSLSGSCTAGKCACNAGWAGQSCALLDRRPAASRAAAGIYGFSPNVTSWGGNILKDNLTGFHHLYVSEIAGPNGTSCGLGTPLNLPKILRLTEFSTCSMCNLTKKSGA